VTTANHSNHLSELLAPIGDLVVPIDIPEAAVDIDTQEDYSQLVLQD
jgi:hypothetical protein